MKEDVLCVTGRGICISITFFTEQQTGDYQIRMVVGVGYAQDITI